MARTEAKAGEECGGEALLEEWIGGCVRIVFWWGFLFLLYSFSRQQLTRTTVGNILALVKSRR